MKAAKVIATVVMVMLAAGCRNESRPQSGGTQSGQEYNQPSYTQPTAAPPTTPTATTTTVAGPLPAAPAGSYDANGTMTQAFIRQEAKVVLDALVQALSADHKVRVTGIPLAVIEDQKEVNAYAGCSSGRAFMGITAPLLMIQAATAEAKAYDEQFGSRYHDEYISSVAADVRAGKAVTGLQAGKLPQPGALDQRKLARQKYLLDTQLAFVLGHELAHHYRGHTGCANGATAAITPADVANLLSGALPIFNQPLEIEADQFGVRNTLDAGVQQKQTAGAQWTEEGAMLTLDFFGRLSQFGPEVLLLGFLQTHPHPTFRTPIVQTTAQQWRQGVGQGGTNPFPIPFPIQIPVIPGITG